METIVCLLFLAGAAFSLRAGLGIRAARFQLEAEIRDIFTVGPRVTAGRADSSNVGQPCAF